MSARLTAQQRTDRETVLKWAAYVHDTNYEFGGEAEEVERVLTRLARSPKATKTLLTMYNTGKVYRRYYGDHEDRRTLLDELYTAANNILAKTLRK